jgi:di/tricarboxylate transporter
VGGRLDRLNEFRGWLNLKIDNQDFIPDNFISGEIKLASIKIKEDASLINQSVYETNFRNKYGVNILAVKREDDVYRVRLSGFKLTENDELLVQGKEEKLSELAESNDFYEYRRVEKEELRQVFKVQDRVFTVKVPKNSKLIDQSLSKSRMGAIFDLSVVAIIRNGQTIVMPSPEELIKENDMLVIEGSTEDLEILHDLQEIEIEQEQSPDLSKLESEQVGLIETTLSPRSSLNGKTLRQIHFRMKYGLQIIAIWREGRAIRSNLRDIELKLGDALLILGPHKNLRMLSADPDFIVLSGEIRKEMNTKKAPLATLIMAGILLMVLIGLLPIAMAALLGVVLMIVSNCITIDDAYRAIDWKAVFLIAGMLPVGIALQKTGAASMISYHISGFTEVWGIWGILIGLYILITLASTVLPTSALVVLMAPVVFGIAQEVNGSPYTFMMLLAIAASTSFLSPVSHPANVLVMGPGGYRFIDYVKVGLPLTIIVMIVGLLMLSVFWPVK